ncbi:MAG: hypothetical protein M1825_004033 [Sarcosagium campestre]|nr:MAG: hypothetical protein M1825_004033 [Sarcosagium campestre]
MDWAYDSMKACPLRFSHPSEAGQLHGLGPKICDRLTEKLKAHCASNGLPMPEAPQKSRKRATADDEDGSVGAASAATTKKQRKPKQYVPPLRSGPYAIILALSSIAEDSTHALAKSEIIAMAQPLCDSSFTAPSDPSKFFTAWNSMKTLLSKELVYERGRPLRKYALTEEGWEVARRIKKAESNGDTNARSKEPSEKNDYSNNLGLSQAVPRTPRDGIRNPSRLDAQPQVISNMAAEITTRVNNALGLVPGSVDLPDRQNSLDIIPSPTELDARHSNIPINNPTEIPWYFDGTERHANAESNGVTLPTQTQSTSSPLPSFKSIVVPAKTFSVELVLDNREVRTKQDRDYIQEALANKGVQPITRSLELGDAIWVAKCHDPAFLSRHGEDGDEIVLDYIVERKRLDDLISSIKDGRFHEQKFRLRKSGLKNVIYIIEEISMNADHFSKYEEAVESAISSTQVVDGFFVKRTPKLDDTIRYLARMTMLLKTVYENRPLHIIPTTVLTPQNHLPLLARLDAGATNPARATTTTTTTKTKTKTTPPAPHHHLTFPAFSSLASKSDSLTLRDVYLKMLMCTRGVTADKALEIQRRWPTPAAFLGAFDACGRGDGNADARRRARDDMLLGAMGSLVGRRKVGKALSKKVAEVWGDAVGLTT